MACCLLAALLFAAVHRVLDLVVPGRARRRETAAFAPSAVRRAPGAVAPPGPPAAPTAPPTAAAPRWPARALLLGAAAGLASHAVVIDVLTRTGTLSAEGAITRDLALAVAVAVLLAVALRQPGGPHTAGTVLAAAGAVWAAAGLVEMHVLGSLAMASHTLGPDLLFHGSGLALALVGLTLTPRTRAHSPREALR